MAYWRLPTKVNSTCVKKICRFRQADFTVWNTDRLGSVDSIFEPDTEWRLQINFKFFPGAECKLTYRDSARAAAATLLHLLDFHNAYIAIVLRDLAV